VRGAKAYAAITLGPDGGILIHPWSRFGCMGIAASAIGFALVLLAMPPAVPASETIQPMNFEQRASLAAPIPNNQRWRVLSLDTEAVFDFVTEDRRSVSGAASSGRPSSAEERLQSTSHVASFDERFSGAVHWAFTSQAAETRQLSNSMPPPSPARRALGPSARSLTPLPPLPPAGVSKKQIRIAYATEDATPSPDEDSHTAIYDISAHKVYLPNGQTLEAHSGFGSRLDNPRYVSEKDVGPTPPNVYDLALRDEPFHGVRALRLTPVGDANMFGRDGLLAHSYMLGPNGQSNGCVSFSDYPTFLNAYLGGEVTRLVVVEHLAIVPSSKTVAAKIAETFKALFWRS
jgi:hypothetical protein